MKTVHGTEPGVVGAVAHKAGHHVLHRKQCILGRYGEQAKHIVACSNTVISCSKSAQQKLKPLQEAFCHTLDVIGISLSSLPLFSSSGICWRIGMRSVLRTLSSTSKHMQRNTCCMTGSNLTTRRQSIDAAAHCWQEACRPVPNNVAIHRVLTLQALAAEVML